MTKRECAIVEAYTGICMLQGDDQKYSYLLLEELFNRPVWTHEIVALQGEIKQRVEPLFMDLCRNATGWD